jgi:Delta7-sterol 5-desaturase
MSNLSLFLAISGFLFSVYLLIAGGAYAAVWRLGRERHAHRRLQVCAGQVARAGRELWWSSVSILVISALLTLAWRAAEADWSLGYFQVETYGWIYLVASVGLLAVVHDSFYYWAHRALHHPLVFRYVHKLHHSFTNPTPFASYAFHPAEAAVEGGWFLSVTFLLPLHPYAVAAHLLLLTVFNVISHLGYEFYRPAASGWFITSSYHHIHHACGKRHFTLRFKLWDRWMGSNSREYVAQLQRMEDVREPLRYDGGHERTTNTL